MHKIAYSSRSTRAFAMLVLSGLAGCGRYGCRCSLSICSFKCSGWEICNNWNNYMEYRFLAPVWSIALVASQNASTTWWTLSGGFLLIYWKQFIMHDCKMSSSVEAYALFSLSLSFSRSFSLRLSKFRQFFTQPISCIMCE